jgi:transposase-like protein
MRYALARVADVACKYGARRCQIYDWRKRLRREGRLVLPESAGVASAFAAVVVEDARERNNTVACIENRHNGAPF